MLGFPPPSLGVTTYLRALAIVMMLVPSLPTAAADISDPTLPPAPMRAETAPRDAPAAAEPARLQMILRGPGEHRSAIVDGRALRVGDSLTVEGGNARVIRITESALVVRRDGQRAETIELVPGSARAVRCTRVVGPAAVACAAETHAGPEKTR
jgi:hypothetical protein